MQNLIIAGNKDTEKNELGKSILDLYPSGFTNRLHHAMSSFSFGRFKVLPYLKCVLFDEVPSIKRLLELDDLMRVYAPSVAVVYILKEMEDGLEDMNIRFNVVTLLS